VHKVAEVMINPDNN